MPKKATIIIKRLYRHIALCSAILLSLNSFAIKEPEKHVRSWHYQDYLCVADSVVPDTSYHNMPMRDLVNDYSIANSYSGNLISPIQSKIFFDRDEDKIDFLFGKVYTPYILTAKDIRFFDTTVPFSQIAYKKGFTTYREDNDISFLFTGNVTRRTNLGLSLNYINTVGHYASQSGKDFFGSLFGGYKGDHYSLNAALSFSKLSNFENGGLLNPSDLGGSLSAADLPVNLSAMSGYRYIEGFLNHRYSICVERERTEKLPKQRNEMGEIVERDTVVIDYIPVTTFMHTLSVNQSTKRYLEQNASQGFYQTNYFSDSQTKDSTNVLTISNTLAVTFEEEFNKWLHFGATVYARNDFERYGFSTTTNQPLFDTIYPADLSVLWSNPMRLHTDTTMTGRWTNNTWVGGSLYKNMGKWVHYGFNGDVCVVGYKIGEFQVNGHVDGDFRIGKDTMYLKAKAYLRNQQPDYFLQHYRSNHYCWENDFQKIYRFYVGGEVSYPTKYVVPKIKVDFENLTRYIYFGADGMPVQHNSNIQVLAVNAEVNLRTGFLALDNNIVYQLSSSEALPLPTLTLYHNLYYYGTWFKALDAQIGVDMRFHTKYYAPLLNPATGQFMIQDTEKIGNYPVLNVYANFYVRSIRLKLFAHFTHFNQYFMKNKTYFTMPGYALNPPVFRAGLAWHFYK